MVVVSACLVGVPCRYNGGHCRSPSLLHALRHTPFLALCPEVLGGLPVPRPPAQIFDGDGFAVLAGQARLLNEAGHDVTAQFLAGAQQALALLRPLSPQICYLKTRSPSCGWGQIGASPTVIGVWAALLVQEEFRVIPVEAECRFEES